MTTTANLNAAQSELLRMIHGSGGCAVYGRAYAATAEALRSRGLVTIRDHVLTASMGKVERRPVYSATEAGANICRVDLTS